MTRMVRVEKRKWNGDVSTVDVGAQVVGAPRGTVAWFVTHGSERRRPKSPGAPTGVVEYDELWLAAIDDWWVLCAEADADGVVSLVLHAATPTGPGAADDHAIVWVDLDLDFEVRGDDVRLEDEAEFHRHAATMAYPPEVIRGAWGGVSRLAARYTMGEWPFDGWLDRTLADLRGGEPDVHDDR